MKGPEAPADEKELPMGPLTVPKRTLSYRGPPERMTRSSRHMRGPSERPKRCCSCSWLFLAFSTQFFLGALSRFLGGGGEMIFPPPAAPWLGGSCPSCSPHPLPPPLPMLAGLGGRRPQLVGTSSTASGGQRVTPLPHPTPAVVAVSGWRGGRCQDSMPGHATAYDRGGHSVEACFCVT